MLALIDQFALSLWLALADALIGRGCIELEQRCSPPRIEVVAGLSIEMFCPWSAKCCDAREAPASPRSKQLGSAAARGDSECLAVPARRGLLIGAREPHLHVECPPVPLVVSIGGAEKKASLSCAFQAIAPEVCR